MCKVDYIIVGQGIAGSVLALTLINEGCSVRIIDSPLHSRASRVAAGLYNPVVFKRLTTGWKINELLPFAETFYRKAEKMLGDAFFFKKNIVKFFTEEQERILWMKKLNQPGVSSYLSPHIYRLDTPGVNVSNLECAEVLNAGYLNVNAFVMAVRETLKRAGCLVEETFEYSQLLFNDKGVSYQQCDAEKIIFCEGFKAIENPYFNWLPFKLSKGEVLTIRAEKLNLTNVLNKGVFVLPIGNHLYKVGATYEWEDLTEIVTEKGKNELLSKLKNLLSCDFEIVTHEAGVRPTVADRRPFLGLHPEYPSLGVFNGLGTKAVLLAPYFANELMNFLIHEQSLHPEVSIERCFKNR